MAVKKGTKIHRWKKNELAMLSEVYFSSTTDRLIMLFGRDLNAIRAKANKLGLHRDPAIHGRATPLVNPYKRIPVGDRIYLAALIDGEGSIMVAKRVAGITKSGKRKTPSRLTILSISNTDAKLITSVKSMLGGIVNTRFTSHLGRKPVHTWQLGGALRCKQLLSVLYPHMRENAKRERVADVLSYVTPAERKLIGAFPV